MELEETRQRLEMTAMELLDMTEKLERVENDASGYLRTILQQQEAYKKKILQKSAINDKLMRQLQDAEQHIKELIATAESNRINSEHLAKQVVRLQSENVQLRENNLKIVDDGEALEFKMENTRSEIEMVTQEVKDLRINNAFVLEENKKLRAEVLTVTQQNSFNVASINLLRADNTRLETVNRQLNSQTPLLMEENKKFVEQTTRLVEEKRLLTEEVTALKTKLVELDCTSTGIAESGSLCGGCLACQLTQANHAPDKINEKLTLYKKLFSLRGEVINLLNKCIYDLKNKSLLSNLWESRSEIVSDMIEEVQFIDDRINEEMDKIFFLNEKK